MNREREFAFLDERFAAENRQLVVIYGRRRIGKTALVTEYLDRRGLAHVYFLADQRGTPQNAERFARTCADAFDDVPPAVEGFDDGFEYVARRSDDDLVVVIDEFSYLVDADETIPSIFQRIYDEVLADTAISMLLLGSSISLMEEGALSHDSPLYGRRTGQWKLTPLTFADASRFFPSYDVEDLVRVYAVLGGVPAYLEQFDSNTSLERNIRDRVLQKGTFLYEEPEFFLRQELREPGTYFAVLEAMAVGNTRVTEIANAVDRDAKGLSRYLQNLQRLEVVDRLVPVTDPQRKQGIYTIADQFFEFWFRFVAPNIGDLEQGNVEPVASSTIGGLDEHASRTFERICRQVVRHPEFPVAVSRVGTWWHDGEEIDVVAVNEAAGRILLGECKWTNTPVGEGVLADLERKTAAVRWRGDDRTEQFALFSRSGFTAGLRETSGGRSALHLFDLTALADLFEIDANGR